MAMLTGLMDSLMAPLAVAIPFLFVLTVVVFVHELGHFLVARWCSVKVDAFSIGFGKEIWGFTDRHGTRWRFAWIPLGGYVKFMDDDNAASAPSRETIASMSEAERAGSFHAKPVWQRAAVVAAGPLANFLFSILIFALIFMALGVTRMEPRVAEVLPDTPAAKAGFQSGDLVLAIDGTRIDDFADLQRIVSSSPGRSLVFEVDRDGKRLALDVQPELREQDDRIAGKVKRPLIGIRGPAATAKVTHERVGPLAAVGLGVERTWEIITSTLGYIRDVIRGQQPADQLGGPVRIADVAGKVAKQGIVDLVFLTAFLSVSIGLLNLFPVPVLDGGHLVFYAIEAIRGRPLSEGVQDVSFRIGLALILMLMVFSFRNDLGIIARWLS
ncbi:MAG: RIP metalloprotease RseP [Pseudomonadota bacterium]